MYVHPLIPIVGWMIELISQIEDHVHDHDDLRESCENRSHRIACNAFRRYRSMSDTFQQSVR